MKKMSLFLIIAWISIAIMQTIVLYKDYFLSAIIIWILVIILILKEFHER